MGGISRQMREWIPKLERDDRLELYARIRADSSGGTDFFLMMVLATTLACLGLLQGSTAVVIGAMLVAPLVGPLLGTSLALVQGNVRLLDKSLRVALSGVAIGFAISILFGWINPGYEPTLEIEARGQPDLLDLFIALASGMVAAYAQGRPALPNTIAGVAIAAALLPPLAVVGIAAMAGEIRIAAYAGVLLVTNLVAIILGAALVFRLLGVRAHGDEPAIPPWARRTVAGLLLVGALLAAPLLLQGIEKTRVGQDRPYSYPTSVPVRKAVRDVVSQQPGMELIFVARNGVEPEAYVTVVLSALNPVPPGFRNQLHEAMSKARGSSFFGGLSGEAINVRIYIIQQAPELF